MGTIGRGKGNVGGFGLRSNFTSQSLPWRLLSSWLFIRGGQQDDGRRSSKIHVRYPETTNWFCCRECVQASLRRHVAAINKLTQRGMKFWDYGNSLWVVSPSLSYICSLLEASRAKADILTPDGKAFRYPSYVQDIMGDIFSLGFGPFRCKPAANKSHWIRGLHVWASWGFGKDRQNSSRYYNQPSKSGTREI